MLDPCFYDIEQYLSIRLDCDLTQVKPGQLCVVETPRRLQCEPNYQYIRACWWLHLFDGRSVISVPPGAGAAVQKIIDEISVSAQFEDQLVIERLRKAVDQALAQHCISETDHVFPTLAFACNASLLRKQKHGECRRLTDDSLPTADGFAWPPYSLLDGILYGVIADGKVVAVASTRQTGVLEDRVVDIGIVTAPAYQRKGYAQTAVSAIVEHITEIGGEAIYICKPKNLASIATVRSVGFVEYGRSLQMRASMHKNNACI